MAGRARAKALADELQARVRRSFDDDEATTLDYVAEWVESGNTLKELCAHISTTLGHEVTYARLMATLREQHGAEAADSRLRASRARASHSMAEHALELVDAKADTNVEVSRAASRARTRQWLAERWNQAEYGQAKGVSVTVTVGSLHLDALRALPARATAIVTGTTQQALASPAHNTDEIGQVLAIDGVSRE